MAPESTRLNRGDRLPKEFYEMGGSASQAIPKQAVNEVTHERGPLEPPSGTNVQGSSSTSQSPTVPPLNFQNIGVDGASNDRQILIDQFNLWNSSIQNTVSGQQPSLPAQQPQKDTTALGGKGVDATPFVQATKN